MLEAPQRASENGKESLRKERGSHLDLDAEDTLAEQDVADGLVDEVDAGLTGVDHEAVGELHALGASGTELARHDDLATLGVGLHDEAENTVACPTDGKTAEELVPQRFALGDGAETAVLDLFGVDCASSSYTISFPPDPADCGE